ncbi:MAG: hypothetical protein ABIY55_24185 [Kofleriaceae bacterium]
MNSERASARGAGANERNDARIVPHGDERVPCMANGLGKAITRHRPRLADPRERLAHERRQIFEASKPTREELGVADGAVRLGAERAGELLELRGDHRHPAAELELLERPVVRARERRIECDHMPSEVDVRRGQVIERPTHTLKPRRGLGDIAGGVCGIELGAVVAVAKLLRLQLFEQSQDRV